MEGRGALGDDDPLPPDEDDLSPYPPDEDEPPLPGVEGRGALGDDEPPPDEDGLSPYPLPDDDEPPLPGVEGRDVLGDCEPPCCGRSRSAGLLLLDGVNGRGALPDCGGVALPPGRGKLLEGVAGGLPPRRISSPVIGTDGEDGRL